MAARLSPGAISESSYLPPSVASKTAKPVRAPSAKKKLKADSATT